MHTLQLKYTSASKGGARHGMGMAWHGGVSVRSVVVHITSKKKTPKNKNVHIVKKLPITNTSAVVK